MNARQNRNKLAAEIISLIRSSKEKSLFKPIEISALEAALCDDLKYTWLKDVAYAIIRDSFVVSQDEIKIYETALKDVDQSQSLEEIQNETKFYNSRRLELKKQKEFLEKRYSTLNNEQPEHLIKMDIDESQENELQLSIHKLENLLKATAHNDPEVIAKEVSCQLKENFNSLIIEKDTILNRLAIVSRKNTLESLLKSFNIKYCQELEKFYFKLKSIISRLEDFKRIAKTYHISCQNLKSYFDEINKGLCVESSSPMKLHVDYKEDFQRFIDILDEIQRSNEKKSNLKDEMDKIKTKMEELCKK